MRLFMGYIPLVGTGEKKKNPKGYTNPRTKHYISERTGIAEEEFLTLKEVEHYIGYAGELTNEVVVIDVDNKGFEHKEESLSLLNLVKDLKLKCKVIETDRGHHFYFKKPTNLNTQRTKQDPLLRIGIRADFLMRGIDKKGKELEKLIILKLEGKERPVVYEADEIGDVPYFLFPMPENKAVKFSELREGKRNNTYLTYQINLASEGLSEPEIRETIKLINKYIVPEPLDDDDMETVTRTEAVTGATEIVKEAKGAFNPVLHEFLDGKTILYDKYAKYLIQKLNIIKKNGFLHIYINGIYKPNNSEIDYIGNYIANEEFPNLSHAKHTEIKNAINRQIIVNSEEAPNGYVALQNGYIILNEFNPITGDFPLHQYSPETIFTQYSPVNYDPNAPIEPATKLIMTYANGREDLFQLLCEMIGYCFLRGVINFQAKCFIITGNMNNGKTTFTDIITALLGADNVVNVGPQKFGERFSIARLNYKLANIVQDLNEGAIEESGSFKEIVDGTPIYVENKGEHPFFMSSYATNIWCCNNIPRIKDDTMATKKRLFIIPFDREFTEADMKYNVKAEMTTPENLSGLLNLALKAIKGVIDRSHFTKVPIVEELTQKYASGASQILGFIEECEDEGYSFEGRTNSEVFDRYNDYCMENRFKNTFNPINFSMKLCKTCKLETVRKRDGYKTIRIYMKK